MEKGGQYEVAILVIYLFYHPISYQIYTVLKIGCMINIQFTFKLEVLSTQTGCCNKPTHVQDDNNEVGWNDKLAKYKYQLFNFKLESTKGNMFKEKMELIVIGNLWFLLQSPMKLRLA